MATNFPTSLDNLTNPAGSDPVNNPSHASQHANLNDAIEKLEEKVGVNNSAVTTSLDYRVKQLETNPVASYTDEEARDAIALALTGSGGITVSSDDIANTITVSTDSTIATKTYVDTAVSNLGNTSDETYVPISEVGQPDGIATLDENSRIPLAQLGNLIDGAPAALDTLNELAAAINDDASYAAGITTALSDKASLTSANTFTVGPQQINTGASSNAGLIIKGAVGQNSGSALTQWQSNTSSVLAQVTGTGRIYSSVSITAGAISTTLGTLTVVNPAASTIGAVIRAAASQTANLLEFQNSSGTAVTFFNSSGGLTATEGVISTAYSGGKMTTGTLGYLNATTFNPSVIPVVVRGVSLQTADLQQWQNSTGTAIAKIDASGAMFTITPTSGTNTTQVATTAFVQSEIDANVQPGALYQTTAPTSPEIGQIWIDSDEDVTTFDSNIIRRKAITATAGQTVFTADLPFIDGFEQIFMNGLLLVKTTDYTTSNSNTVTLTSAAAASDIIEIVSVTGANSVDTYTQAEVNALLAANTSVAPLSISANTTLVAKKRYFVTSASALTLTLPASPALNDEIQIVDASGNASTYNITVARNGNKINGGTGNLIIDNNGGWYTLLYTGTTYGWKVG
jgi:hypothetical protein